MASSSSSQSTSTCSACSTPAIKAVKYQSSFASVLSYGCCNHASNYGCDDIHNLENLLKYDEEENSKFVENAQESLRLMENNDEEREKENDVGVGSETLPYIDFSDGELRVLDVNYFPSFLKYPCLPLRKMSRYTGLIFDWSHQQVGERLHFMKPQFVGTRFNVNGLNSIEPSERRCKYEFGVDLNFVGDDVDEWGNFIKVPLQLRDKTFGSGGYSEEEFIKENGMFYEGMITEEVEEEEEEDVDVKNDDNILQQLKKKLGCVVFDDADDEMINFNYVCSKWRSPGHLWVELPPQDVLVEFGSANRPFVTNQYFCLTSQHMLMSDCDDYSDDDEEWQCSKLLHRVAWKNAVQSRVYDFNVFMNYAYGEGDRNILDIISNHQFDRDECFFVDPSMASSSFFRELRELRKEFHEQWKLVWNDYRTNPFLKSILQDESGGDKWNFHKDNCISKESKDAWYKSNWTCECALSSMDGETEEEDRVQVPSSSKPAARKEIIDELKELTKVGHALGYVWAFALNQMMISNLNCVAMTDAIMKCGVIDDYRQILTTEDFLKSRSFAQGFRRSRNILGQSQLSNMLRNRQYIDKLQNADNGLVALNDAVNEMLPPHQNRRIRRISYSYFTRLNAAAELMVHPRLWDNQCVKIWDVKFSNITNLERNSFKRVDDPEIEEAERKVVRRGFDVGRRPSVCTPNANLLGTKFVVGCGVIERPYDIGNEPAAAAAAGQEEDEEEITLAIENSDAVFSVDELVLQYPSNSPTNDKIVFGVDARFVRKANFSYDYSEQGCEEDRHLKRQLMKAYTPVQREILAINGIFRHMYSTSIKAISMGALIKEKEILRHYYTALCDDEVKEWYEKHHQAVMERQKIKFLKEHSKYRREVFFITDDDSNDADKLVALFHIEDVKRKLVNILISSLNIDMKENLQCDVDQMPNHPSYQIVGKSRMNTEKLILHLAMLSNDKKYFTNMFNRIYRCKCFM